MDDIWGLGESSLLLIEDELDELLNEEDEDHERCYDDWKSSFGCKSDQH